MALIGRYLMHHNAAKTHCPQGHPYSGENLRINGDGSRACRTCRSGGPREASPPLSIEPILGLTIGLTTRERAEALGMSTRTWWRWVKDGVPARHADTAACRLGHHPSELWPEEWPFM